MNAALYGLTLTEGNPGTGESGGAVNNYGTLVIANSSLTGSTAEGGGGVYNDSAAILTVMGSRISGNSSTTSGGGIANFGVDGHQKHDRHQPGRYHWRWRDQR